MVCFRKLFVLGCFAPLWVFAANEIDNIKNNNQACWVEVHNKINEGEIDLSIFDQKSLNYLDKIITHSDVFNRYMIASLIWTANAREYLDLALCTFAMIVHEGKRDFVYDSACKISQITPEKIPDLADSVSSCFFDNCLLTSESQVFTMMNYPSFCEREPAEYTEEYVNLKAAVLFKDSVIDSIEKKFELSSNFIQNLRQQSSRLKKFYGELNLSYA